MPPRRSCFRPGAVRCPGAVLFSFQCHHGVPASSLDWPIPPGLDPGFNATTAFLLPPFWRFSRLPGLVFQCHHGVPASDHLRDLYDAFVKGFNATTAFLLPWPWPWRCARRSGFNATTAFLLPPPKPPKSRSES